MKTMMTAGLLAFACATAAIAATDERLAGQWESTVTDRSGGAPRVSVTKSCVEPGDTIAAMLKRQMSEDCRATRNVASGGRIDVAATCAGGTSTLTGTYTPTTLAFAWKGTMRMGGKALPIDMSVKSRRIGATCTDDE